MEERIAEKSIALVFALLIVVLSFFDLSEWGICDSCNNCNRLLYPFAHSGIVHASMNAFGLLSAVFGFGVGWVCLVVAYVVAVLVPGFCFTNLPTIGASGMVYFLFALISFKVRDKWLYQLWMFGFIGIGFLFPAINSILHLYCYVAGLFFALVTKPFRYGNKRDNKRE